jgi:hypothetical protein
VDPLRSAGITNRAIRLTQSIRDRYELNDLTNNPGTLISYYAEIVNAQRKSIITEREAAFLIADTVYYKVVSVNSDVEVVVVVASEIEKMETDGVCRNLRKHWENLARFIHYQNEVYQSDNS